MVRLSELVTDVQAAFLSSRRQSFYPDRDRLDRTPSVLSVSGGHSRECFVEMGDRKSSLYIPWRQNSSASACQPLRRYSSFQTKKRTFSSLSARRRYSFDNKLPSRLSPSLLSDKQNGSPRYCQIIFIISLSIIHTYFNIIKVHVSVCSRLYDNMAEPGGGHY